MGNRNCPVCGKNHSEIIEKIEMKIPEDYRLPNSYDVVVCEECGMVYADTVASMEDYDWYYTHCNFYGDDSKDDNSDRFEIMKELIEKYLAEESVLLELGAGNGRFDVALKKHGYKNIKGTDPSEESVKRLREAGIMAETANIYDEVLPKEAGKYNGIFLFEVAEHLLLPRKGIENIAKRLKTNGVFMISVPDYSMIGEDAGSIPNHFNLEHINYFSENSLDYLMAAYGMKRMDQKHTGMDLIQVYQKNGEAVLPEKDTATEAAVRRYFGRQREKSRQVEEIIETLRKEKKELVIWGTGSFVMNLFATTSLRQCNIDCFVDNNKIKQGRQMFGYDILPPDCLKDRKCTILVCSMQYGERIREQIEGMHTENTVIVL